ncbi:phage tail protein [Yersinia bercovieri]|uniref:phage tail protein n=2 Tax=Yersinia bercovieri TaxID=634 RepID=UPI0005DF5F0E|nr:phage tail protein [Yersinia bercovieri]MDN0103168.1 phage tail protein [Yersinia bercovieri]CNH74798.1 putative tail fiber assembly protein [Yersinia bercovieri]
MKALFSPTLVAFIPENMAQDGSFHDDITKSLIVVSDEEQALYWKQPAPSGQMLGVADNRPVWVDIPPLSPPPPLTADQLAAKARQYRDDFIVDTDPMMVSDYSIDDKPLTTAQRDELTATRAAYRAWPTVENWPLIELPELPQWLLVEAVNQGYRVPVWP